MPPTLCTFQCRRPGFCFGSEREQPKPLPRKMRPGPGSPLRRTRKLRALPTSLQLRINYQMSKTNYTVLGSYLK